MNENRLAGNGTSSVCGGSIPKIIVAECVHEGPWCEHARPNTVSLEDSHSKVAPHNENRAGSGRLAGRERAGTTLSRSILGSNMPCAKGPANRFRFAVPAEAPRTCDTRLHIWLAPHEHPMSRTNGKRWTPPLTQGSYLQDFGPSPGGPWGMSVEIGRGARSSGPSRALTAIHTRSPPYGRPGPPNQYTP